MSLSRIIVVDDFKDWQQYICTRLETCPELRVICEVSDGFEAVQKAEELKPDLILLDIGLPNLNGIEAATRISQIAPGSKILFLSQDNDAGVVEAALSTGASGYVRKVDAEAELLPAIAAVLAGGHFVSSGVRGDDLCDAMLKSPFQTARNLPLAVMSDPADEPSLLGR